MGLTNGAAAAVAAKAKAALNGLTESSTNGHGSESNGNSDREQHGDKKMTVYELQLEDDGSPSKQRSVSWNQPTAHAYLTSISTFPTTFGLTSVAVHSLASSRDSLHSANLDKRRLACFKVWCLVHDLPARWQPL